MFICDGCGESSQSGEKPRVCIFETRARTYPPRRDAMPDGRNDPGGTGWEIVRTKRACPRCFEQGGF